MNVVDVVYELTAKKASIWKIFTIDFHLTLLNTAFDKTGKIIFPTNWNPYWAVSTKAPDVDLFNTRFSISDFMKLINADVPGLRVLVAGYPSDDVETMLANRKLEFTRIDYDLDGNTVEVPDIMLDENGDPGFGVRIAPTSDDCDRYRQLYPEVVVEIFDGEKVSRHRGNFSRHSV